MVQKDHPHQQSLDLPSIGIQLLGIPILWRITSSLRKKVCGMHTSLENLGRKFGMPSMKLAEQRWCSRLHCIFYYLAMCIVIGRFN
ncbi:hypothetical protein V6Z11_D04G165100 [Gossypium hirsutum]